MGEESSGGSWWGGWLQAAKDKSSEAITFIRRDLEEFSSVVQTDTKHLVASTASSIRDRIALQETDQVEASTEAVAPAVDVNPLSADPNPTLVDANPIDVTASSTDADASTGTSPFSMFISADEVKEVQDFASKTGKFVSKGFSSFLSTVSQALIIPPDDDDSDPIVFKEEGMILNRPEARLHCLRVDPSTYADEPEDPTYERWLDQNDLEKQKTEIANLLVDCPEIRVHYTHMVPALVSHAQFWSRYFFKLERMEEEERRRAALKARADDAAAGNDVALGWGDDDDDEDEEEDVKDLIASSPSRPALRSSPPPLEFPPLSNVPFLPLSDIPNAATDSEADPSLATVFTTALTTAFNTAFTTSSSAVAASTASSSSTAIASSAAAAVDDDSSLLRPDFFQVETDVELSAAQIDSLLSMEDELRGGGGGGGGGGEVGEGGSGRETAPTPPKMDPEVVDQVLEREASLSPLKNRNPTRGEAIAAPSPASRASPNLEPVAKDSNAVPEVAEDESQERVAEVDAIIDGDDQSNLIDLSVETVEEKEGETKEPAEEATTKIGGKGENMEEAMIEEEDDDEKKGGNAKEPMKEKEDDERKEVEVEVEETVVAEIEGSAAAEEENRKTIEGLVVVEGIDDDSAMASRTTPTPTSSSKESAASDDWEKELELDLTEEERNLAEKLLSDGEKMDDDWENWE